MKVKNKLRLGFGFLFVVVLFFGAISLFYVNEISNSAKIILKDNYETLNYVREMQTILDDAKLPLDQTAINSFSNQLAKEEHNITEHGELNLVENLSKAFIQLQNRTISLKRQEDTVKVIRDYLRKIERLNMRAIVLKNDRASASVDRAILLLGLAGSFTFLVLFSFSVNFPDVISKPLNTLLQGIRAISTKNYQQRIHFDKVDEFAEVAAAFNDMAIRLNEWENSNLSKIMSEKLRIETIIEEMQDAIIGVNENQEILFMNTSAKNILNLSDQKIEGKTVYEITKNNQLLKLIIDEHHLKNPFKITSKEKDLYFQLEVREITVPNLDAKYNEDQLSLARKEVGKVYMLRNVTEFKERDVAKTNFIATISHEFKTPISSIKLSLQLLQNKEIGALNEEQKNLLESIGDDISRLLKITSELLNMTQVESGNIQLSITPSNPKEILAYAIQATQTQADQKHIQFQLDYPIDTAFIQADREKTAWILTNLISNAIRYSYENSTIYLKIEEQEDRIKISVRDTGQGIAPQYKDKVFNRYFRVPGTKKEGTGLGLAISKEFIEAQNGEITVESELGKGSVFTISLRKLDGLSTAV